MRRKYLVSTDCSGILGTAPSWGVLWEKAFSDPYCEGVEMIGWKWSPSLMLSAKKQRIHVAGMHGRTAGWSEERSLSSKIVMGTLNTLFVTNTQLCSLGEDLSYILLHRSTITTELVQLLEKHKEHLPLVVIENVLAQNDFEQTIETILYLRAKGIQAGFTFDIVHFLREPELDSPQMSRFSALLRAMRQITMYDFPVNIHFPIGTYINDSLPLNKLTPQMWKELAHAIDEINPRHIVLENQQIRAYSIFLPPWKYSEVAARNGQIIELLIDKEII